MPIARRQFLGAAVAGTLAQGLAPRLSFATPSAEQGSGESDPWEVVRRQFRLSPDYIHMSAMLLASHPDQVRTAIERFRAALDSDPVDFLSENNGRLHDQCFAAAEAYIGADLGNVALTDSTTAGVGLVYNGLRLKEGQEILTTQQDYFVTREAIRVAAEKSGAVVRAIELYDYDSVHEASADEIADRILAAIGPATRVIGATWVHSSTGLKLPVQQLAAGLAEINASREEEDQVLFVVDGVHGFGCENFTLADLGCDFLAAGCHKWLFGPRGTGILAGSSRGWRAVSSVIPSFLDDEVFDSWIADRPPRGPTNGRRMSPGGFKAFEHVWALPEAFRFHERIGKGAVAERTHELASQLKDGLRTMSNVALHTPGSPDLSAGIVSFHLESMDPVETVRRLWERGIVASVAPYRLPDVRLTPSIRNSAEEIDVVLAAVHDLAG